MTAPNGKQRVDRVALAQKPSVHRCECVVLLDLPWWLAPLRWLGLRTRIETTATEQPTHLRCECGNEVTVQGWATTFGNGEAAVLYEHGGGVHVCKAELVRVAK